MRQSKLIELLRKIPPRQLSRFGEFLRSPYFNKIEDNLLFFSYLEKYSPSFNGKGLDKAVVISRLKVSKPLDEKGLAYLMNQQMSLLETFLAVEQFLGDDFGRQLKLMRQFHQMQLPRHYKTATDHAEKIAAKNPLRNAEAFQNQLVFKSLRYEHSDPVLRAYDETLQAAADALDVYFIVEKLRLACKMVNLGNFLNISYRMPFLEQALEWSGAEEFSSLPTVQIYQGILLLLRRPEDTAGFDRLKMMVAGNEALFEPQECKQLYTLLLNYCTRRINRFNDERFLHEYLEINKLLLENGLIFESGSLQPWRYANLANAGLKLGQTAWVWAFIHRFKNKLPEAHAENTFGYTVAQYNYYFGEMDKAQRALLHVDFSEDVLLNVVARSLLIKIYYETGQQELLLSFLEATRLFLHRNRLLDQQMKRQMQKFLEFTGKLARLERFEKEKIEALSAVLPSPAEVMHRDWIWERAKEKLGLS